MRTLIFVVYLISLTSLASSVAAQCRYEDMAQALDQIDPVAQPELFAQEMACHEAAQRAALDALKGLNKAASKAAQAARKRAIKAGNQAAATVVAKPKPKPKAIDWVEVGKQADLQGCLVALKEQEKLALNPTQVLKEAPKHMALLAICMNKM